MFRATIFLLLLLALSACGSPATSADAPASANPSPDAGASANPSPGPDERQITGIIDYYDDRSAGVITAPQTVRAGEAFEVTITTFGGGCERAGGADVKVEGTTATIAVYDFTVAGPAVSCIAELKRLPRTVTLRFDQPGAAVIRVEGQRVGQDAPAEGVATTLEQPITVQ